MTHKQHAATILRPWLQTGSFGSHIHEIIANLKHAMEIPTGYQDKSGFHYGVERPKKELQHPQI